MESSCCKLVDIKSPIIFQKVLSHLCQKTTLDLITYNKLFQKRMKVGLKEYKIESGKIKVGERNGIAKELFLDSNILIFKGEYLNGKKNGKGKAYFTYGTFKF